MLLEHVKNLIWGTGKTKGTSQTMLMQACAMTTRKGDAEFET